MKKIGLITLFLVCIITTNTVRAYDFEVDGVYYNIISVGDLTCEVTNNSTGSYSGEIVIPAYVDYRDRQWSVISVGDNAFHGCSTLRKVTLNAGVVSIGTSAFMDCTWLNNLILPESITSIGEYAFSGCSKINILSLPSKIKTIGAGTFSNCTNLTGISLPDSLKIIDKNAFNNSGLLSITLPPLVEKIENKAFAECVSLQNVQLSDSLKYIKDSVFYNCGKLQKIIIPQNVSKIGKGVFYYCPELKNLKVNSNNKVYDSRDNANAIINTSTNELLYASTATVIPNSVTSIAPYAFTAVDIKELTIPASVLKIQNYAFNSCTSLKKLIISDSESVLQFGYSKMVYYNHGFNIKIFSIFYSCNLTDVYIGRNLYYVTDVDDYTSEDETSPFIYQKSLETVEFGNHVTAIGPCLFMNCSNLQTIKIPDVCKIIADKAFQSTNISNIVIPKSVTTISGEVFYDTPLSEITFEDGDNDIILGGKNFNNCKKIFLGRPISNKSSSKALFPNVENVSIGDSVKTIKSNLFADCEALKTLDLGKNLNEIGEDAFLNCDNIEQITSRNTTPPANAIFSNSVYMDANVTVPYSSLNTYQVDTYWRNFWNISEMDFSGIDDVIDEEQTLVDVYNLQGVLMRKGVQRSEATLGLPQGIYVIGGKKISHITK